MKLMTMRASVIALLVALACTASARSLGSAETEDRKSDFLYVYDLPEKYGADIQQRPLDFDKDPFTLWYDTDEMLHHYLKEKAGTDPEKAEIFMIPIYISRYMHSFILNEGISWNDATERTTKLVSESISWVKQNFPFWNATNGLNHFIVFPLDHARCNSMKGLTKEDFGNLFSIQTSGDVNILTTDAGIDKTDSHSKIWHCYQPNRDIVVPFPLEYVRSVSQIVTPHRPRNISVLYRFVEGGRGDYAELRNVVLRQHHQFPIDNSVDGWADIDQTHEDMKNSIFCVTPPGISQSTLRIKRSIIFGCIPVTFFHGFDRPYEQYRSMHLSYNEFSVNINRDELHLVQPILRSILNNPSVLSKMQENLAKVQSYFVWDAESDVAVQASVLKELEMHPSRLSARQVMVEVQ